VRGNAITLFGLDFPACRGQCGDHDHCTIRIGIDDRSALGALDDTR
jgi:hypothetical protein